MSVVISAGKLWDDEFLDIAVPLCETNRFKF